ncbi:MCE family protein [Amycolatopsis saalfeldensis]|uniref:Phospholipid/cholesterol/gamma-HCH transport system substrate-binding protein n=1 Tax=Amycolatopsis saalfeldensis TaxID=394193 RepID=A0A1H8YGX1_9PSEU|nr:MlaD family protein [Amycolatopsis saalfeldensis]SEP51464.1 phospholipid/cholesterol/gamma-HCH transport system substrate-binding protein [Amycolatopsis saalfeldensis]
MRNLAAPLVKSLIFILVTAVATLVLALSITGGTVGSAQVYGATFLDATALNVGDDVRISGVKVGQVESLEITGRNRAHVSFSLEQGRTLPSNVSAVIKYRNMVGQRYIALDRGEPGAGPLPPGGEIPLSRTTPALDLTDLFNGFKPLFQALSPKDVNDLSGEIVQVLQGEGGTVDDLLAHTGSLTTTLADRDQVIGRVIDNLNSVLKTVNGKGDALATLISTLRQLVSGLAGDRTAIGDAIGGIADLSQSTAGLFEQARPGLKDSISGLGTLSQHLNTGQSDVDNFLNKLPPKLNDLGRIGSYGSWLNFYLCSATLQTSPPRGVPATAARCGA